MSQEDARSSFTRLPILMDNVISMMNPAQDGNTSVSVDLRHFLDVGKTQFIRRHPLQRERYRGPGMPVRVYPSSGLNDDVISMMR